MLGDEKPHDFNGTEKNHPGSPVQLSSCRRGLLLILKSGGASSNNVGWAHSMSRGQLAASWYTKTLSCWLGNSIQLFMAQLWGRRWPHMAIAEAAAVKTRSLQLPLASHLLSSHGQSKSRTGVGGCAPLSYMAKEMMRRKGGLQRWLQSLEDACRKARATCTGWERVAEL